jgi:starvation-inducible DNA-binding protein
VGTLECPEGFVLDENMGLCVPESPTAQAREIPFAPRIKDIPKKNRPKDKKALEPIKDHAGGLNPKGKYKKKWKKNITATELLGQIKGTASSLSPENSKLLANALFHLVADNFAMAIKGYNFHWNVVAPTFEDLHEMFGDDYETLLADADVIAERIRALGFSTAGSLAAFSRETSIEDQERVPSWREMVSEWVRDHEHMAREAREAQRVAEHVGDNNTLAMLDSIILCHEKRAWMFKSMLGESPDQFPR